MGSGQNPIDPARYRSAERARAEWDRVWIKCWHAGPRVEELPEPGDVMVHSLGGESLLFVHDQDGTIRGWFNLCRHRGNRLILSGDGPTAVRELRCAFHGWRYGLDGALIEAPYAERFGDCLADQKRTGLKSFRVEAWAGWLWFTLDDDAPPFANYLGPMRPLLEPYRLEKATIVDYKTFEFDCNWKTVLDAFNESYHFQALHSDILAWGNEDAPIALTGIHSMMVNEYGAPSRLYPDQATINPALRQYLEFSGIDPDSFSGTPADVRLAGQAARRRAGEDGSHLPYATLADGQLSDAYHYLLFPSLHLNLFPEFQVAMRYRPHPSGDPLKMYFDFIMLAPLAPGEAIPSYEHRVVRGKDQLVGEVLEWGARRHPIAEQVLGEDIDLIEQVQAGTASIAFDGPILSEDERRIAHFHANLDRLLAGEPVAALIADNPVEPAFGAGAA
ncbi:aromatic ring-hydroxylating dioxygenase subunit alpha [Sphingomonas sp. 1P06PA]|uniref:aromatic ring-hydroxylating oxygenase subunit alpha n=1 Tax=Sphingomonas sp. 1P06PA TaxID=554121 RepID=UPI0039A766F3